MTTSSNTEDLKSHPDFPGVTALEHFDDAWLRGMGITIERGVIEEDSRQSRWGLVAHDFVSWEGGPRIKLYPGCSARFAKDACDAWMLGFTAGEVAGRAAMATQLRQLLQVPV